MRLFIGALAAGLLLAGCGTLTTSRNPVAPARNIPASYGPAAPPAGDDPAILAPEPDRRNEIARVAARPPNGR